MDHGYTLKGDFHSTLMQTSSSSYQTPVPHVQYGAQRKGSHSTSSSVLSILPKRPPTPIPWLTADHQAGRAVLDFYRKWVLNQKSWLFSFWYSDQPRGGWPCTALVGGEGSHSRSLCRKPVNNYYRTCINHTDNVNNCYRTCVDM